MSHSGLTKNTNTANYLADRWNPPPQLLTVSHTLAAPYEGHSATCYRKLENCDEVSEDPEETERFGQELTLCGALEGAFAESEG